MKSLHHKSILDCTELEEEIHQAEMDNILSYQIMTVNFQSSILTAIINIIGRLTF